MNNKVIIIEDDAELGESIKRNLVKMGYSVASVVTSGEAALDEIKKTFPIVALIDITLCGDMNAIDTAHVIHSQFNIPVIFITADISDELLDKIAKVSAYGILLKPVKEPELKVAIKLAVDKHALDKSIKIEKDMYKAIVEKKNAPDNIFVKADFRLNRIKLDDLVYVSALKDYVTVHTSTDQYTTHVTMKEIMKFLPEKDFKRIHRGYIVRLDKIFSIKYPDLIIEGSMKTLPIGGLYRKELYACLNII